MSKSAPKPHMAREFYTKEAPDFKLISATEFWLCNSHGDSYYLRWFGTGWTIIVQQSFLCKDKTFRHCDDIVNFDMSKSIESTDWSHVFETKEAAVGCFIEYINGI